MTNLLHPVTVLGAILMTLAIVWMVRQRQARRRRQLMLRLMDAVMAPVWISGGPREWNASAC